MMLNQMKIYFLIISTFILFVESPELEAHARESGWVPAPQKVDSNLKKRTAKNNNSKKQEIITKFVDPSLTVYENQKIITEDELNSFIQILPLFRTWARQNHEDAHPILSINSKPDFQFSQKAAQWVQSHGIEPRRFFCIMGKMAAGLVIVEEGNDLRGTRPPDMPSVDEKELDLLRKHLGELLHASGPPSPIN